MAKYCSLRCWLEECDVPHCHPAGSRMHWGAGCSQVLGWRMQVQVGIRVCWAVPAVVICHCHQPVCWYRAPEKHKVIHQVMALFDSFPGCYLLGLFFLSLFHASALSLCPLCVHSVNDNLSCSWCPPCWWQRALRGDVPAHKCLLSCCCRPGDKCQPEGCCRDWGAQPRRKILSSQKGVLRQKRFIRLSFVKGGKGR